MVGRPIGKSVIFPKSGRGSPGFSEIQMKILEPLIFKPNEDNYSTVWKNFVDN